MSRDRCLKYFPALGKSSAFLDMDWDGNRLVTIGRRTLRPHKRSIVNDRLPEAASLTVLGERMN